ncbi:MAG: hypothetical protein PHX43_08220 [Alphaproteobacteria bacterium]|nr:hypothetical protein [Alphaproteobacteria bacterium]
MSNQSKKETIVVKIGTDALLKKSDEQSAKYLEPDINILGSVIKQLAALKKAGHTVILVSSGAVGTGRAELEAPYKDDETIPEKQMYASVGQPILMKIYIDLCKDNGLLAAQYLAEKRNFGEDGNTLEADAANSLEMILSNDKLIAIVNENDVTATQELCFSDNDELASLLAVHCQATRLMFLTSINEIYESDPKENPDAKALPHESTLADFQKVDTNGKSGGGKGGMESKLIASERFLGACPNGIINILSPQVSRDFILDAIEGKKIGTMVVNGPVCPGNSFSQTALEETAPAPR